MERTLTWKVEPASGNLTVEQFLRARGCSHHVLTCLKQTERGILQNGVWVYTNQKLQPEDELTIRIIEDHPSSGILPVRLPLDIVYEDADLLVVNKPSGMPIHPSINNYENTLANAVMAYFTAQDIPFVYRCINRLDRDTSGLLIVAKHGLSAAILSRLSAGRAIHREYLAVVEGVLPESGTIDAPIARLEGSALMRCIDPERGQRAVTHYRRLAVRQAPSLIGLPEESNGPALIGLPEECDRPAPGGCSSPLLSLAAVTLETGRTHQIRVHMAGIGHPLVGDFLYNPGSTQLIARQALHAHRLEFRHPVTGELLRFHREMPEDMRALLV